MFWISGGEAPEENVEAQGVHTGPIEIERDAPRPATILRVAGELEGRGGEIQELFMEVRSSWGQVVLPIHLLDEGRSRFVEVETEPWDPKAVVEAISRVAVLRNSEHAEAELDIVSAYPVPREVGFFFGRSAAALFQLDLAQVRQADPEEAAAQFREVASRHWGIDLDYETGYLPLVEELIMAALDEEESPPILDELVVGLGCFVGETIRRNASAPGYWRTSEDWGDGLVVELGGLELDPIGKSRAFLQGGQEDSVAFYADYVLEQLDSDRSAQA